MIVKTRLRRTAGLVVLGVALMSLGACSVLSGSPSGPPATGTSQVKAAGPDADTIALVSADLSADVTGDVAGAGAQAADRRGLRIRLLRALHATWVTQGQDGTVTHQAIRGEVTSVSTTSIQVKAKDGVSISFIVVPGTKVRKRSNGVGQESTIGAVTVGDRALVIGVGEPEPTAKHVIFLAEPAPSTSPS